MSHTGATWTRRGRCPRNASIVWSLNILERVATVAPLKLTVMKEGNGSSFAEIWKTSRISSPRARASSSFFHSLVSFPFFAFLLAPHCKEERTRAPF